MDSSRKRKRFSYDASFKLKVIQYAETHGYRAAGREFNVGESSVRDWIKSKDKLKNIPKSKRSCRYSVSPFIQLESDLFNWITNLRSCGLVVTRFAIRLEALKLYKTNKSIYQIETPFKASEGWCTRFMNRTGLVLRTKTHISQKLPKDVEDKVLNFQKFVINERKNHAYLLSNIGNMDETPLNFDVPHNKTVNIKGQKSISIKTTGHEKDHFTVVLACLADGTKLKPMIIFKRKTMPKEKFPKGVIIKVHPKGWMDETLVGEWLEEVWGARPGGLRNAKSLLVWDQFRAHLCDSVKQKLSQQNTRQAVIPGGCTSLLQPLDVSLNKPFKNGIRKRWTEWMLNGEKSFTKGGAMKKAELSVVATWVKEAWEEISVAIVIKSFKKCSISNSMDGSEDDILYSDVCETNKNCENVEEKEQQQQQEEEEEEDEEEDNTGLNTYYDANREMTDEQIRILFESDSEDDDFLGF